MIRFKTLSHKFSSKDGHSVDLVAC